MGAGPQVRDGRERVRDSESGLARRRDHENHSALPNPAIKIDGRWSSQATATHIASSAARTLSFDQENVLLRLRGTAAT